MRRKLHRSADRGGHAGPCITGDAYSARAERRLIIMVEKTSFMGLGGPNLVKGATGEVIDQEALGGAHLFAATSGRLRTTSRKTMRIASR